MHRVGRGPPRADDFFDELEHLFLMGLKYGLAHPGLARIAAWIWHVVPAEPDLAALGDKHRPSSDHRSR